MTPPIQEPSTPRSISGLTWGDSQLFRRPAPVSAGGMVPSWARAQVRVETDALNYVEPQFSTGLDAEFARTDDGNFSINGAERLVLASGTPGMWVVGISLHDFAGTGGKDTVVKILMNLQTPVSSGNYWLPGWYDNAVIGNLAIEYRFPLLLDAVNPFTQPWGGNLSSYAFLYQHTSDEDNVFRFRCAYEEDTDQTANEFDITVLVTKITNEFPGVILIS